MRVVHAAASGLVLDGEHAASPEGDDGVGLCVEASRLKGAAVGFAAEELALVCGQEGHEAQDGVVEPVDRFGGEEHRLDADAEHVGVSRGKALPHYEGKRLEKLPLGHGRHDGHGGDGRGFGFAPEGGLGPRCGIGFGLRFRGEHRNVGLASGFGSGLPAGGRVRDVHALGVGRVPDLLDVLGVVLV